MHHRKLPQQRLIAMCLHPLPLFATGPQDQLKLPIRLGGEMIAVSRLNVFGGIMPDLDRHSTSAFTGLSFLWLELTNRCNLQCVHCYAESNPWSGQADSLRENDYHKVLEDAFAAGCRKVQFIGGEATLNAALPALLTHARQLGYQFIDVYSNLVRLPLPVLESAEKNRASFGTSVYSDRFTVHDGITQSKGSHARTLSGIRKLLSRGIPIRVGFVEMEANQGHFERTTDLLRSIGITRVARDIVRPVGRAAKTSEPPHPGKLCGHCWKGSLCVHPDGTVSPCIMSKAWSVGDVKTASIGDILLSDATMRTRQTLHQHAPRTMASSCIPVDGEGDPQQGDGGCAPIDGGAGGEKGGNQGGNQGGGCFVAMKDEEPETDA